MMIQKLMDYRIDLYAINGIAVGGRGWIMQKKMTYAEK